MRIPTLLALGILVIGFILETLNYYRLQQPGISNITPPLDIQVVNITDQKATIVWQTTKETTGFVSWGDNQNLGSIAQDLRDTKDPTPHITHFVNLDNLKSDTEYFLKVRSGPYFYPPSPIKFRTSKQIDLTQANKTNEPISGVVLSSEQTPVDEALIVLSINNTVPLATLTTTAGNFILPTTNLMKADLSGNFAVRDKTPASLVVSRGGTRSEIKLTLPTQQPLPKIFLGKDDDFSLATASPAAQIAPSPSTNPYDLNGDGVVNVFDLDIVLQNLGKTKTDPSFNPKADLDHDGDIDQTEVDLMKKALH